MSKQYIKRPVTSTELRSLSCLAIEEETAFFRRNSHLIQPYRNRLLLIALCQGAALEYLGYGYGVQDFDVHFFYAQNAKKPNLSRSVKRVQSTVGNFPYMPIDFVRTVIPDVAPLREPYAIARTIRKYCRDSPTPTAKFLAEKAIIGLFPSSLYASQIWPPNV